MFSQCNSNIVRPSIVLFCTVYCILTYFALNKTLATEKQDNTTFSDIFDISTSYRQYNYKLIISGNRWPKIQIKTWINFFSQCENKCFYSPNSRQCFYFYSNYRNAFSSTVLINSKVSTQNCNTINLIFIKFSWSIVVALYDSQKAMEYCWLNFDTILIMNISANSYKS